LERVKISEEQSKDVLHLRRANRILSVGSTTAIEDNRLTVQQVFDVINGKVVLAPLHDIKEWSKTTDTHAIIKSSAMHFMIEHIHPFPFIDFMIDMIEETVIKRSNNGGANGGINGGLNATPKKIIARVGSDKTGYWKIN
jgi:Fic family protein